ncbi:hypothetical protein FRC12_006940 [Ceratobasidium sp. 428]|nr:hypothetical protein FRC12_006951 [Ceratobasidium sp. 428]KAG8766358.1 hypothetical protein FRC12_006940 [Ceratobasidium sp. 428]
MVSLQAFITGVVDIFAARYVTVASIMLLFWDHVITLDDEITLIWPAKFGIVKAIFLFNRYAVSIWIAAAFSMMSGLAPYLSSLT